MGDEELEEGGDVREGQFAKGGREVGGVGWVVAACELKGEIVDARFDDGARRIVAGDEAEADAVGGGDEIGDAEGAVDPRVRVVGDGFECGPGLAIVSGDEDGHGVGVGVGAPVVGVPAPVGDDRVGVWAVRGWGRIEAGGGEGGGPAIDVEAAEARAGAGVGDPGDDAIGGVVVLGLGGGALRVGAFPDAGGGGIARCADGPACVGLEVVEKGEGGGDRVRGEGRCGSAGGDGEEAPGGGLDGEVVLEDLAARGGGECGLVLVAREGCQGGGGEGIGPGAGVEGGGGGTEGAGEGG